MIQVTAESFRKQANDPQEKVVEKDGIERKVWIAATPLCAIQDINKARYFPGITTSSTERFKKPGENNV